NTFTLSIADANEAPTALTLSNVTSALSDTISTAARVHLADLAITDDALGSETIALTGADAASFEIYNGALYLKAGVSLDADVKAAYSVSITVDDATIGAGPEITHTFNLDVGAGLGLAFANTTTSLAENTSTAARIKVADLLVTDDAGTPTLSLTGADAASFEIDGGALYLKAGVALNYEAKASYAVSVVMDEPTIGSGPDITRSFTLSVSDVNEAPTAIVLSNTVTSLAENTSTASRIKVADISLTDDALGSETISIIGSDASFFEIDGGALYLKAGVALNFEGKQNYSITVIADDASIPGNPDVTQAFNLALTNVNEAPTALTFTNTVTTLAENTSTAARVKVADLNISDDALGTETNTLSGADASSFEIYNGALYLKAGVTLNYEAKSSYSVIVNVDDTTVGSTPDVSQSFTLTITDVNEAPSAVAFTNTTTSLAENSSTATRVKMADIGVTDDALGSESFYVSGADAASFEIISGVLYLKSGVALDYEAKASYAVMVNVDDTSVGANPDAWQSFTLNLTNVNEAPSLNWSGVTTQASGVTWTNGTLTLAAPEDIATGVVLGRLSTIDAEGSANLRYELTGANAGRFTINATTGDIALASALNYEASPNSFSVGVTVWDGGTIGAGLSASGTFTIAALNVNEAPVGTGFYYYYAANRPVGTTVGTVSASDPESQALTFSIQAVESTTVLGGDSTISNLATTTYTVTSAGVVKVNAAVFVGVGALRTDTITVRVTDASGLTRDIFATAEYDRRSAGGGGGGGGGGGVIPPIVFDLNGDGITLTSFAESNVEMDSNGDGVADPIGWIGADDGFLALDRNGDGFIGGIDEIRFTGDAEGARSDLEGLRVYDTNENGFLDAGDARFGEFRIWQDLNQDGIGQADEVTGLADRQVTALNLSLTLTGQSLEGATDNVLYGTSVYVRDDG
ncbi:MAG TPA: cadherin domain-containing protein, partial [Verrucomicrobiae bacterium]|nr:cadherin domain-containing protein [Verrucomicrobiae bacterium]